ncbi:MAG: DUF2868 domain-containing protein [Candidatus Electrothrix sp. AUS1_2]|nr:DUF2868 domain-containing protein [Candidatus Electrothrix sp. AUS1_2]
MCLVWVCFNVGVLAATLFKVIGADVAFGWQSTLQITPASVHELVQWIALPWSWLPDNFIPTLRQIEGSRLVLKEGIYLLENTDLTSWWPFLCLSVLCYGLLPRLLLLLIVSMQQRRNLAELDFRQGYFRQTLHRMRTPRVSTAARRESTGTGSAAPLSALSALPDTPVAEKPAHQDITQEQREPESGGESPESAAIPPQPDTDTPSPPLSHFSPLIALIPDEILPDCPLKELEQQIRDRLGYTLTQHLPFWTLENTEEEELAQLKKALDEQESGDVLVLLEAWQPPIEELFSWLGQLRRTIGPEPIILAALIGKPQREKNADTILTPVQPQHLHIWQQKTAMLGDPGLQLIELVKS